MDKVSVIIPTFNRFNYLLNAIDSVKKQTYKNVEIIVVNDCSTEKEYYDYDFGKDVIVINLEKNSKSIFGYACAGYVRNQGINASTGDYIAFLDDDDIWFPNKLEFQINRVKETNCKMSCTEGLIGHGIYDESKNYKVYNRQHYFNVLREIYRKSESNSLENGFPFIWDLKFLKIHNCCITSSVVIKKDILDKVGNFKEIINAKEDYDCWLRALEHTNCVYIKDICFYYDLGHGDGQNY
jgi:glycosyltransferase involved in cell wall biosynthesis